VEERVAGDLVVLHVHLLHQVVVSVVHGHKPAAQRERDQTGAACVCYCALPKRLLWQNSRRACWLLNYSHYRLKI
jgi:hypothetical protein